MDSNEKSKIYDSIVDQYTSGHSTKYEEKIDLILEELSIQNKRSLIILGCAYIEELCKDCFYEKMTIKGRKEFKKRHSRELTFSSSTTFLYAQNYFSEEIFLLIDYIRDIRNKYAHLAIIEDKHRDSIKDRNKKLRDLLSGRWVTRDPERIKKLSDVDDQLYYIVFENLIYGLMALEMFIIPNQKLARLQFIKDESHLRVSINVGEINEYSESYFANKFNSEQ